MDKEFQPSSQLFSSISMSLVVQTPMSSSSTSWAPATATATSPNQQPFPTTKSSIVILVLLGLGCLAALVAFFLRQRRISRRGWATRAAQVASGNANIPMVMEKPKLWDLRNGGQPVWGDVASLDLSHGDTYGQWANIMVVIFTENRLFGSSLTISFLTASICESSVSE